MSQLVQLPSDEVELMLDIERGRQLSFYERKSKLFSTGRQAEVISAEMLSLLFDQLSGL